LVKVPPLRPKQANYDPLSWAWHTRSRSMAFDGDYGNRKGFDTAFLRPGTQDGQVFLPRLSPR